MSMTSSSPAQLRMPPSIRLFKASLQSSTAHQVGPLAGQPCATKCDLRHALAWLTPSDWLIQAS
jgi:hypothetical protein